eukprot:GEMP01031840.1.p1 GENE.GEMP01031840.1~~GEMP01031840.1.p1  ORF type:complete len:403 (+),score=71.43 GEMP01031840.1:421-1629(+)
MKNTSSVLCYYGSLAAYVTQYRFYRGAALMIGADHELYDVTAELMNDAATVVRFMLIMKNNCLDFLDSSSWGIQLLNLVEETREPDELRVFEDEHAGDQLPMERNVLLLGRDAVGNDPMDVLTKRFHMSFNVVWESREVHRWERSRALRYLEQMIQFYDVLFVVCTSPLILCMLVPESVPLFGYLLEPPIAGREMAAAEPNELRARFAAMQRPNVVLACGHRLLRSTFAENGLDTYVVRPVGLYSEVQKTTERRVLIVGTCADAKVPCFWSRINGTYPKVDPWIFVMDGAVSRAVFYPQDIVSSKFYELYATEIPIFLPDPRLSSYYLRGSYGEYLEMHQKPLHLPEDTVAPGTFFFTSAADVLETLDADMSHAVALMRKDTRSRLHHAANYWGLAMDRIVR